MLLKSSVRGTAERTGLVILMINETLKRFNEKSEEVL